MKLSETLPDILLMHKKKLQIVEAVITTKLDNNERPYAYLMQARDLRRLIAETLAMQNYYNDKLINS